MYFEILHKNRFDYRGNRYIVSNLKFIVFMGLLVTPIQMKMLVISFYWVKQAQEIWTILVTEYE